MNFSHELFNKLDAKEWELCPYYILKAQDCYDNEQWNDARNALQDAVDICLASGEENAANKIQYYLRFC